MSVARSALHLVVSDPCSDVEAVCINKINWQDGNSRGAFLSPINGYLSLLVPFKFIAKSVSGVVAPVLRDNPCMKDDTSEPHLVKLALINIAVMTDHLRRR